MSRSELLRFALLVGLGLLSGCSLLIDTDPYVGSGGDGGTDAAIDPDAPTAPEVAIDPSAPVTTDDLSVSVVTESTDPLDAGPVTYEYRWLRDGADAGETSMTVTSSATARDETWRVEVTPVSADGTRRGAPGTAEVTIGNLPPTIGYVGLDHYRPIHGEVLQAFVGGVDDPDGDATRVSYRWTVDDVEVPSITGPRLTLDEATYPAGAEIRVEATPDDSTDSGPTLRAGPAIVLADETRWRQLLPNRTFEGGDAVVYDALGRRIVFLDLIGDTTVRVWEYAIDDAGGELTQLHPTGEPPPLRLSSWIYDERNRRVLFFGGLDIAARAFTNVLYSLDLSQRGAETWQVLGATGPTPSPRVMTSLAYDPNRGRVLMFGGLGDLLGTTLDDLWSLDASRPGFEAWTEYDEASRPGAAVRAAFLVDPTRDRALLIGGADLSGADVVAFDTINTIPLDDLGAGFTATGERLPQGVSGSTFGVDPSGDRAVVAFGQTDGGVASGGVYAVDFETLGVSTIDLGPSAPSEGGAGLLVRDRYADRLLLFPGSVNPDTPAPFDLLAWTGTSLTPIHSYGVDLPPARANVSSSPTNFFYWFGGEDDEGPSADVWRLDDRTDVFTSMMALPDVVTGRSPSARASAGWSTALVASTLTFFGGREVSGFSDSVVWSLERSTSDTMQWIERTIASGSPAPPAMRAEAFHFNSVCMAAGYFGGDTGSGPSNQTGQLDCAGAGGLRDCTWVDPIGGGTVPPARSGAAGATFPSGPRVMLFGGASPTVLNDVWVLDTCAAPPTWSTPSITGTSPPARSHHSVNAERDRTDATFLVFGGRTGVDATDLDDAFELVEVSSGTFEWRAVAVAAGPNDDHIVGRHGHAAFYSDRPENRRLLVYGGVSERTILSDLWELRLR